MHDLPSPPAIAQLTASAPPTSSRARAGWRSLGCSLVDLAISQLLGSILGAGAFVILATLHGAKPDPTEPGMLLAGALGGWLVTIALVAFHVRGADGAIGRGMFQNSRRAQWGWGLSIGLSLAVFNVLASALGQRAGIDFGQGTNQQALMELVKLMPGWLALLLGAIVVPLIEELLFRRVLYRRFLSAGMPVTGAVWVSLLFVLLHSPWSPSIGLTVFLTAMYALISGLCCWAYARSGSVLTPFAVHAMNNTVALAAMVLAAK